MLRLCQGTLSGQSWPAPGILARETWKMSPGSSGARPGAWLAGPHDPGAVDRLMWFSRILLSTSSRTYFTITKINLKEKSSFWHMAPEGWESIMMGWRMAASGRHGSYTRSQKLRSLAASTKHTEQTRNGFSLLISKVPPLPHPAVMYFLLQGCDTHLCQTVPLTGDQLFECLRLWGHFSFEPL